MTAAQIDTHAGGHQRSIGPLGTTARVLAGGLLVASVTWGHPARGFQIGCALFWPVDQLEYQRGMRRASAVGFRPLERTRR